MTNKFQFKPNQRMWNLKHILKHDSKTNVEMKKTENTQDSQVFIEEQSSTISGHLF